VVVSAVAADSDFAVDGTITNENNTPLDATIE